MKKRICAVIMCLLLAVNLVGVPKAKAVATETALLGSIFGSLLVSMGYSWAADNMDVPGFGEAIYDLIQEFDDSNKDTGVQLIRDLNLAALSVSGPGKIQLNYQWVSLARSFAEWFQGKFLASTNSAVINSSSGSIVLADGSHFYLSVWDGETSHMPTLGTAVRENDSYTFSSGAVLSFMETPDGLYQFKLYAPDGTVKNSLTPIEINSYVFVYQSGQNLKIGHFRSKYGYYASICDLPLDYAILSPASSLSAEKPAEVHYPDVAEDGSQVYEVTYQGVTATDIEGIIQGAVDQILAGTAAIAGEVTQAQDVPVTPEVPAAGEYAVPGLETIFPFCIPFDIYAFCSALNADPVAPSFEWRMQYAPLDLDYTFVIDLSAFDSVAQVLRTMELLAFCVGLAFWTRHLIRG